MASPEGSQRVEKLSRLCSGLCSPEARSYALPEGAERFTFGRVLWRKRIASEFRLCELVPSIWALVFGLS